MKDIVQTLWIGNKLSTVEKLSLSSFVYNGFETHLYTYGTLAEADIPKGVVLMDAAEILPESMIFQYTDHKSYSAFSNFFRYKLLFERGSIWVDTDVVCLKPFEFKKKYVFCSEEVLPLGKGNTHVGSCFIKAPIGSPVMKAAYDECMSRDRKALKWGEIGPSLVKTVVENYNMNKFVLSPEYVCPIPGCLWAEYLVGTPSYKIGETTIAVHLWNEMWRRAGVDKEQKFHKDSLYEQMKTKYLGHS